MRVLVQRSLNSSVSVDNEIIGKIDKGLVLFVGFTHTDDINDIKYLTKKVVNLRIFEDENGIMNKSITDVGGSILSISQFTLYADSSKGNRPSYVSAMGRDKSIILYDEFNKSLRSLGFNVEEGKFGSDMKVSITNDGPTTILLESRKK